MAEVPVEHEIDGKSFLESLTGQQQAAGRDLFWHFPHYRYNQVGPYSVVRSGDWKLIRYDDPEAQEAGPLQLFNLAEDPGEQRNLAQEKPHQAQELEAKLDAWLSEVGARLPKANPDYEQP
jgi:arylsulfatase A-like enzyme